MDDNLAVSASSGAYAGPVFLPNYTLIAMGSILDTSFNTGPSLIDLSACFVNNVFNISIKMCMYTWKVAQYERYGLLLYGYTVPLPPFYCDANCVAVPRNTSTQLVTFDLTNPTWLTSAFSASLTLLPLGNITFAVGNQNQDYVAVSGAIVLSTILVGILVPFSCYFF